MLTLRKKPFHNIFVYTLTYNKASVFAVESVKKMKQHLAYPTKHSNRQKPVTNQQQKHWESQKEKRKKHKEKMI